MQGDNFLSHLTRNSGELNQFYPQIDLRASGGFEKATTVASLVILPQRHLKKALFCSETPQKHDQRSTVSIVYDRIESCANAKHSVLQGRHITTQRRLTIFPPMSRGGHHYLRQTSESRDGKRGK